MRDTITICIPSIPPRSALLRRAMASIAVQDHPVEALAIAIDHYHDGSWVTRNRAMAMSRSTWTGFLDDDDELFPHHTAHLLDIARDREADVVWGWFEVIGGADPFPQHRARQYDPATPHIFPIAYIARTELLHEAARICGGFLGDTIGAWDNQDKPMIDTLVGLGAHLHADERITWQWHHDSGNTSGLPERWT